jgi:hypothetical protein
VSMRVPMKTAHKVYVLPETLRHFICWRCERVCCQQVSVTRWFREYGVVALGGYEQSTIWPGHMRPLCQYCWRVRQWR